MNAAEKEAYEQGKSFHIDTWTIDTEKQFTDIITNDYDEDSITKMFTTIKNKVLGGEDASEYLFHIDTYHGHDIKPELKCVAPCYTCLEAFPDYCMSCWGN